MPSIPVDILRLILEHVDRADLAKICLLNKVCCSCSQDVLYREINQEIVTFVRQTLAQSTHLAQRVRSFEINYEHPSLAKALRNMSSLRRLCLGSGHPISPTLLEGCTFRLDSLSVDLPFDELFRKFLNSQPSLTYVSFKYHIGCGSPFEETCLPNLTRVTAGSLWLSQLIPGRPVSEVTLTNRVFVNWGHLTFFTLSTVPIWKLELNYWFLCSAKTLAPLASIFPSLTHLTLSIYFALSINDIVRKSFTD
jgi:hypothetical protein